jgi:arylsulfatase A-like enzyme
MLTRFWNIRLHAWAVPLCLALIGCGDQGDRSSSDFPQAGTANGRQDIVIVLMDDVSAHSMGAYGEPEAVATPNFDAIANNGLLYTNVTSSTQCSPSRRSLYYGTSVLQDGVGRSIIPDGSSVLPRGALDAPDPQLPNLAQKLSAAGYRTVLTGKLHTGHLCAGTLDCPDDTFAESMGWDEVHSMVTHNVIKELPVSGTPAVPNNHHRWWIEVDWQTGEGTYRTSYSTDSIADAAVAVLQDTDPRPLALFVMFAAPHGPFNPPPGEVGDCAPSEAAEDDDCYRPAIEYIDERMADIIDELDWTEDILIYSADNGRPRLETPGQYCDDTNSKSFAHPCGTRVPLAIRGAGIETGTVVAPVMLADLHDTLLDIAGLTPDGPESVSFMDCFTNPATCDPRAISHAVVLSPNGRPLPPFAGIGYVKFELFTQLALNGTLYGLRRVYDVVPIGNDPGPYLDTLLDLGGVDPIDRSHRYGQVSIASPTGDALVAQTVLLAEIDRLLADRLTTELVASLGSFVLVLMAGAIGTRVYKRLDRKK